MIFTSLQYAGFLATVVALNWLLPVRWRPALLLAASAAFYATWSIPGLGILVVVCVVAWGTGRALPSLSGGARTAATAASVALTAGSLGLFKLVEAFGLADTRGGTAAHFAVPVGLSFFSFQAISYVVDVHRRTIEPHRSLLDVSLFVAFFPHLLAGPIVRAKKLIPAFHGTPRRPDLVQWQEATELVLVGTFKKVALADPLLALGIGTYAHPTTLGPWGALVALVAVLVGGYFDITGYIDIARGSAKFLGIDMQRNALMPLLKSTGYADFWRRWQLTVMMWFRDYVFLPVRGRKREPWREYLALFATFFVLGVWHGITLGWALWGLASGVIIVAERSIQGRRAAARRAQTRRARKARNRSMLPKPPNHAVELAIALVLVMTTFPMVAARSLSDIARYYGPFVNVGGRGPTGDLLAMTAAAIVGVLLLDGREERREARAGRRDPITVARAVAFGLMVLGVVVFSGPAPKSFLYFAF